MPLTQPQRDHLAKRLREERERNRLALRRCYQRLTATEQDGEGGLSGSPFYLADEGTDAFVRELYAQEASRLSRELQEIDAALERLYREPERFGCDEHTGEAIPFERLDVIPWARTGVARSPRADARTAVTVERAA